MKLNRFIPAGISLLLFTAQGYPFGIRVDDKDALATARGNAFTATADNPSAVYYNPAGITQINEPTALGGGYGVYFDVDMRDLNGQSFSNDTDYQFAPHAYFTMPVRKLPVTIGFGFYVPFGLENNWPDDTTFSTLATESKFEYLRFSPVVAWEITPTMSVAAGLAFDHGKADLRRTDPLLNRIHLEGSDQDIGYILGWHWRPSRKHYFGATYRSRTTFNLEGEMNAGPFETDIRARFPFPDVIVAGYSYRPSRNWNFEFNLDWTNWDILDSVAIKADNPAMNSEMPFHWKSSFIYKFGATRFFNRGYRVSAGYMFSENSIPDEHFNPAVADSDRHLVSAGLGRTHQRIHWDVAYQFGYSPTRKVRGSESPTTETADGDYKSQVHAVSFSVSYVF